jgi:hypothetical protein
LGGDDRLRNNSSDRLGWSNNDLLGSGDSCRGEQVRKENGQVLARMIFGKDNPAAAKEDSDTTPSPRTLNKSFLGRAPRETVESQCGESNEIESSLMRADAGE